MSEDQRDESRLAALRQRFSQTFLKPVRTQAELDAELEQRQVAESAQLGRQHQRLEVELGAQKKLMEERDLVAREQAELADLQGPTRAQQARSALGSAAAFVGREARKAVSFAGQEAGDFQTSPMAPEFATPAPGERKPRRRSTDGLTDDLSMYDTGEDDLEGSARMLDSGGRC